LVELNKGILEYTKIAALLMPTALFLTACEKQENGFFNQERKSGDLEYKNEKPKAESELRDVEVPEVFQKTEMALWDGRPSFGGQWVAHPDVAAPERVVILNTATSESIIGALFKRERETSGPPFQVSSDAAEALGMLAGAPTQLTVTALRREPVPTKESEPISDDPIKDADG